LGAISQPGTDGVALCTPVTHVTTAVRWLPRARNDLAAKHAPGASAAVVQRVRKPEACRVLGQLRGGGRHGRSSIGGL